MKKILILLIILQCSVSFGQFINFGSWSRPEPVIPTPSLGDLVIEWNMETNDFIQDGSGNGITGFVTIASQRIGTNGMFPEMVI